MDSKESKSNNEEIERVDIYLLAMGKKLNLSFGEINEMRVQDLLDYIKIYVGDNKSKKRRTRIATQEDIDAFFK